MKRVCSFIIALAVILSMSVSLPIRMEAVEIDTIAGNLGYMSQTFKSGKYGLTLGELHLTGNQATDAVVIAKSQVGYHAGADAYDVSGTSTSSNYSEYYNWYCKKRGWQFAGGNWCATFTSWCVCATGFDTTNVSKNMFPITSSGSSIEPYSNSSKCDVHFWADIKDSYNPQPGDIVWYKDGHVGMIEAFNIDRNSKTITMRTIEGNINYGVVTAFQKLDFESGKSIGATGEKDPLSGEKYNPISNNGINFSVGAIVHPHYQNTETKLQNGESVNAWYKAKASDSQVKKDGYVIVRSAPTSEGDTEIFRLKIVGYQGEIYNAKTGEKLSGSGAYTFPTVHVVEKGQSSITGTYWYRIDKINNYGAVNGYIYCDRIEPSDKYTISFNANGGSGTISSVTKYENIPITLPSSGFTRSGYTLAGWSKSSSATSASYSLGSSYNEHGTTTFYAVWKKVDSQVKATVEREDSNALGKYSVGNTNAVLTGRITVTGGTNKLISQTGCYLYNSSGTLIGKIVESSVGVWSGSANYGSILYNVNDELKVTLTPGTTYKYKFYAKVNGVDYYSPEYTFTTTGPTPHTHSYTSEWVSNASNHWHQCSCGEKSSVAAHSWDAGVVTKPATSTAEGVKSYTCTVCKKTKTEAIPIQKVDVVFDNISQSIEATNARLSAHVSVNGGTLQSIGTYLYGSDGRLIKTAVLGLSDRPFTSYDIQCNVNQHMDYTLAFGTTYKYKFYAKVNGVDYFSQEYSFKSLGPNVKFDATSPSISETNAVLTSKVIVTGGDLSKITEVRCCLSNSLGTPIVAASQYNNFSFENNSVNIAFDINKDMEFALTQGTDYKYQFAIKINGEYFYSSMYTFTTPKLDVVFDNISQSVEATNARLSAHVSVNGGTLQAIGTYLYRSDGNIIKTAILDLPDRPFTSYGIQCSINKNMDVTLIPDTLYKYKFYAKVNGVDYYSPEYTFTTLHAHSYTSDWVSDTNNHWHQCSCGEKNDVAPHAWNAGVITTAATEDATGVKTYTCTTCKKTKTETIPKLPHTHKYGSTWTSDSNNHWQVCSCGEKGNISAHTWNSGEVTKPATETSTGIKTYTCTVCKKTKTETIPKLDHSFSNAWDSDNNNHWHACIGCGEKGGLAAHTWDSGKVTKAATETATGIKIYTCTVCKKTKTETIPIKSVVGDVNGDGKLDEVDLDLILKHIKGITTLTVKQQKAADTNTDGKIDIRDFNYIYNKVMSK